MKRAVLGGHGSNTGGHEQGVCVWMGVLEGNCDRTLRDARNTFEEIQVGSERA